MMAEGNFDAALAIYDRKGAIHWTRTQVEARAELVEKWAADTAAERDKSRFVFAYTNQDVDLLNVALARRQEGARRAGMAGSQHRRRRTAALTSAPATACNSPAPTGGLASKTA